MTHTVSSSPPARSRRFMLVAIAFLAFISIGLPDGILGVAWPSIQRTFELPPDQLGALLTTGMLGYLVSSFFGGRIVVKLGVGRVLSLSSLLMVIALTAYAVSPAWGFMVAFGIIAGMGSGAIDAGLNTYAAHHFSPRMVNWLHAFYGAGAMLGPLMMTGVIKAHLSWRWGYATVAAMLLAMAICFGWTRRLWDYGNDATEPTDTAKSGVQTPKWSETLRRPVVLAGIFTFFIYVGLEVAAGQWTYSILTLSRGVDPEIAGPWISIYWGSLMAGRTAFGAAAGRWSPKVILRIGAAGVPLGALLVWQGWSNTLSALGLAIMGFSLSPIFPLLISQTPRRVGASHAAHAVGFQVAGGSFGAAAVPALAGFLAQSRGLEIIGGYLLITAIVLAMLTELLIRLTSGKAVEEVASSQSAGATVIDPAHVTP